MDDILCLCGSGHHTKKVSYFKDYQIPWATDDFYVCVAGVDWSQIDSPVMGDADSAPEDRIDPVQLAADFYLLEATKNGFLGENDSSDYLEDATAAFDNLVTFAAPKVFNYLVYAVASELTYYPNVGYFLPKGDWRNTAAALHKLGAEFGYAQVAEWAMEMFLMSGAWGASYGGKPWADIAQVIKYKDDGKIGKKNFSDAMFLDRTFSLQHNTASVFNKVSWKRKNSWNMNYDNMACKCDDKPECGCVNVLNMHATGDIPGLMALSSPATQALVASSWKASGYGLLVPTPSPYCTAYEGCGYYKVAGQDHCSYHAPFTCSGCGIEGTQELNYSGNLCGNCYKAKMSAPQTMTKMVGKALCYGCNDELIKPESKSTGFCTACRNKYAGTSLSFNSYLLSTSFKHLCDCGTTNCGSKHCYDKKTNDSWDAYLELIFAGSKSKVPADQVLTASTPFSELLEVAATKIKPSLKKTEDLDDPIYEKAAAYSETYNEYEEEYYDEEGYSCGDPSCSLCY